MKQIKYYIFFIAVTLIAFAALFFSSGGLAPGGGLYTYLTVLPSPTSCGWYSDFRRSETEAHFYIFQHNFGSSIENARKADVILLGDSRVLLGFDWRQIDEFSNQYNITFFNLAIDGGSGWEFPLHLMQRYDIKPKIVILAVPDAIVNPMWIGAKDALNSSWISALKHVLAGEISWRYRNFITLLTPSVFKALLPAYNFNSTYRSVTNGCWFRDSFEDFNHLPVKTTSEPCNIDFPLPHEFLNHLNKIGAKLIIGNVPNNIGGVDYCPTLASHLANTLGTDHIEVSPDSLFTMDMAHLDKNSSEEFTRRFLKQFITLNIIKYTFSNRNSIHSQTIEEITK